MSANAAPIASVAPQAAAGALLRVERLHVLYGGIYALKGVSLHIAKGELVTLIGCNGAGKSTTLNTIAGLVAPHCGRIDFDAEILSSAPNAPPGGWQGQPPIAGKAEQTEAHRALRRGLALCPEGRRIFPNLTVDENLDLGAYIRSDRAEIRSDRDKMRGLFPLLAERAKQLAGTLSGGEQQMLAIARALMSRPKLLMLDEPSLGLAPKLVEQIFQVLMNLKQEHVTILLVEQNARQALQVADRGYVLETGRIVKDGPARALAEDPDVRKAYLGG